MSDFITGKEAGSTGDNAADKATNQIIVPTQHSGIIAWFAHNHVAANLLMVFILVAGFFSYQNLNKKTFPFILH